MDSRIVLDSILRPETAEGLHPPRCRSVRHSQVRVPSRTGGTLGNSLTAEFFYVFRAAEICQMDHNLRNKKNGPAHIGETWKLQVFLTETGGISRAPSGLQKELAGALGMFSGIAKILPRRRHGFLGKMVINAMALVGCQRAHLIRIQNATHATSMPLITNSLYFPYISPLKKGLELGCLEP